MYSLGQWSSCTVPKWFYGDSLASGYCLKLGWGHFLNGLNEETPSSVGSLDLNWSNIPVLRTQMQLTTICSTIIFDPVFKDDR